MDYKEKYEQALKKAKAYDSVRDKIAIRFGSNVAKEIFSEYEENEDEKIRKGLIDFLKSPFVNENITDEKVTPWIAWLEKQPEQKPVEWSDYDECMLTNLIEDTRFGIDIEYIDWLKSLKQRMKGE